MRSIPLLSRVDTVERVSRIAEEFHLVSNNSESSTEYRCKLSLKSALQYEIAFNLTLTPRTLISTCESLTNIALALRERVDLPPEQLFRLVGVGLSNFQLEEDATDGAATLDLLRPVAELLLQAHQ